MENTQSEHQEAVNQIYQHAANLLVIEKKTPDEVKNALMEKGAGEENASLVVESVQQQIRDAKKDRANKDMLYGALWCIGGTVATLANFGFIFWGAIVFGGIQFFKGVANSYSKA